MRRWGIRKKVLVVTLVPTLLTTLMLGLFPFHELEALRTPAEPGMLTTRSIVILSLLAPANGRAEAYARASAYVERVQKAYEACNVDLQETAAFREPHKNDLPHDAVLCRSSARHKWLPICTYMYDTWKMRMGASKHIKTWSDGCRYFRTPKFSPQTREEGRHFSKVYIEKSSSKTYTCVGKRRWPQACSRTVFLGGPVFLHFVFFRRAPASCRVRRKFRAATGGRKGYGSRHEKTYTCVGKRRWLQACSRTVFWGGPVFLHFVFFRRAPTSCRVRRNFSRGERKRNRARAI